MGFPTEIGKFIEERRAALGADASAVKIPGFAADYDGAYLLSSPTEQRVLILGDYEKKLDDIAIERGEIGWIYWQVIPAGQFFDVKIQDAKSRVVQLRGLVKEWRHLKNGHDIVETRRVAFGDDARAQRLHNDTDVAAEIWLLIKGDAERVLLIHPTPVGRTVWTADDVLEDGAQEWIEVTADLYRQRRLRKLRGSA